MRIKGSANIVVPVLTAISVLGSVGLAQDKGGNLLSNPSFEAGHEMPDHWRVWEISGTSPARDATVSHSGGASARIDIAPEAAGTFPSFRYVLGNVTTGQEYLATAWARTKGMTHLGAYVSIGFFEGNTSLGFTTSDFTGPGDHDWTRLSVRAIVPGRADSIWLILCAHGAGTAWFDDATLACTGEAPGQFQGDQVSVKVSRDKPVCDNFLGFGSQGDFFLTRSFNVKRGVTEQDLQLVFRRVEQIRPHIIRTFFDYKWWEPEEGKATPQSEAMQDYLRWVHFLRSIGTAVLLTPWGDRFAYSDWMYPEQWQQIEWGCHPRLPALEKRQAMVRSLVDLVEFLRRDQGLDNVKYLLLMNEPDCFYPTSATFVEEYVRLNRLLDRMLRERGLRDGIMLLTADESSGGQVQVNYWCREVLARGTDYCDGLSVHTYMHEYVPALAPWIRTRFDLLKQVEPHQPRKPLLITEFGHGGATVETFTNPANHEYEYGLFLADFAITALREGASAALQWCLMDTYYNDQTKQQWGLWRHKDEGWKPRPGFYSWSLITRYTRPGSRVLAVESRPRTPSSRAVALESPEGELTLMAVNRYDRPLKATLQLGLDREALLRLYKYTSDSVPGPGGGMIGASAVVRILPGVETELELPRESFVVLTEVR